MPAVRVPARGHPGHRGAGRGGAGGKGAAPASAAIQLQVSLRPFPTVLRVHPGRGRSFVWFNVGVPESPETTGASVLLTAFSGSLPKVSDFLRRLSNRAKHCQTLEPTILSLSCNSKSSTSVPANTKLVLILFWDSPLPTSYFVWKQFLDSIPFLQKAFS